MLDVPPGSAITLDGVTRVTPSSMSAAAASSTPMMADSSAPFQRGLWIISNIFTASTDDFHLLVVRSGLNKDNTTNSGDCRTLPVGFVLMPSETSAAADLGYEWIVARRYDPRTEEISNEAVDELTLKNLVMAMEEGGELKKFVIPYDQFMGSTSTSNDISGKNSLPSWDARTSLINAHFLQRCHGATHANKIVPSSESDAKESSATVNRNDVDIDGTSISYPPIPCIDKSVNARLLTQHSGTRIYLSKLSPEKRTWLLLGGNSTESMSPGEYVWKDILGRYYGRENDGTNIDTSENDFLADIELSFLLFLFLECHASLEHWRDAISMCSLSTADASTNIVIQHPQFFHKLISILYYQLSCIETDFFQEVEYSAGENNFMVEALRQLCHACENVGKRKRDGDSIVESLKSASQKLRQLFHDRFGLDVFLTKTTDDNDMETDALWATTGEDYEGCPGGTDTNELYENQEEDDGDEEDGPVMIPFDQIEASIARSSVESSQASKRCDDFASHRKEYPLLYAAMSSGEDEVMACARILDDHQDVSLVREAAAYLEEVEAHRGMSF